MQSLVGPLAIIFPEGGKKRRKSRTVDDFFHPRLTRHVSEKDNYFLRLFSIEMIHLPFFFGSIERVCLFSTSVIFSGKETKIRIKKKYQSRFFGFRRHKFRMVQSVYVITPQPTYEPSSVGFHDRRRRMSRMDQGTSLTTIELLRFEYEDFRGKQLNLGA